MSIPQELKDRLYKVYALVEHGATEGEKKAAHAAIERILKKYGKSLEDINDVLFQRYRFTYTTWLEEKLLIRLIVYTGLTIDEFAKDPRSKRIVATINELKYLELHCMYEYFRRHMKAQWKAHIAPQVAKCRTAKTKAQKRKDLQPRFATYYFIKSGLIPQDEIRMGPIKSKAQASLVSLLEKVVVGNYHKPVSQGNYLE